MTRWQEFYREDARVLSAPPSQCVLRAIDHFERLRVGTVLELGCGAGRDTEVLLRHGLRVVGADAADSGLRLARERLTDFRPTLLAADARRLPIRTAAFDGVYSFGLLHEFVGPEASASVAAVMGEIKRVLKPNGLLFLAVLAGDPEAGLPDVQLFTKEMFAAATAGYLSVELGVEADTGCTGKDDYRVWYGAFLPSQETP